MTIFVGSQAWDVAFAVYVETFMEMCESAVVIGMLWIPQDKVVDTANQFGPVLLNEDLLHLQTVVPPAVLTALLPSCLAAAGLINVLFLQWTREYKDIRATRAQAFQKHLSRGAKERERRRANGGKPEAEAEP